MTCPSCQIAEADPRSAEFSHLCASCEGRAAAALGFDEAQARHTLRQISADPGQALTHWRRWATKIARSDKGLDIGALRSKTNHGTNGSTT